MTQKSGGKASRFARRLEGGGTQAGTSVDAPSASPVGVSPSGRSKASGEPIRERGGERTVRVTVDLPRSLHRFLRILAAESDSDGMRVMRAFLEEAAEDENFASRVRERLIAEGE